MASKVVLIDDLDGTEAMRTIRFAFDGKTYEIDLSAEHISALKHGLKPWLDAAREVSKFSSTSAPREKGNGPRFSKAESEAIRTWARANGYPTIGTSGMIRSDIVAAYRAAHREVAA